MAIRIDKRMYVECDFCHVKIIVVKLPQDWRHLQLIKPGVEKNAIEVKAQICPTCSKELIEDLDPVCVRKIEEEGETTNVLTSSGAGTESKS